MHFVRFLVFPVFLNHQHHSPKKMGLIAGAGKQIIWILGRIIFLLLRSIAWILLLRYFKIIANYRHSAYKRTAHVQRILARHKLDAMIQPASANNFLTMHKSFVDPEYVLSKNVTLYCTTKRAAYFVECDPNVDVMSSEVSSFFKIAQFKNAINLIAIPMHVFHKLGTLVGKPHGQLVILTNTTRCGSTLLSQVFEETKECVSISEPDAANTLTTLSTKLPAMEMDQLVRTTINLLCKNSNASTKACVIKLSQNNTILVPYFCRVFPEVKIMFMYRNGLEVSKSIAKVMRGLPMTGILSVLARNYTCMKFAKFIARVANLPAQDFQEFDVVMSHMQVGTVCWASAIRSYLDFLDSGIDIAAVKYEDMVGDTQFALGKIFEYCGMEYNAEAVTTAFSRDSQRASPLSRERLGKFNHDEITEEIKEQTDEACRIFNVPSIYDTYVAKNTITHRSLAENASSGMTTRESDDSLLLSPEEGAAAISMVEVSGETIVDIPEASRVDNQVRKTGKATVGKSDTSTFPNYNVQSTQGFLRNSATQIYGSCNAISQSNSSQPYSQYHSHNGQVNLSFEEESPEPPTSPSVRGNNISNPPDLSVIIECNNQIDGQKKSLSSNYMDMQVIRI